MARKSEPDKKPDRRPAKSTDLIPKDYEQFLGELKDRSAPHSSEQRSRSTGNSSCFTGRLAGTSLHGKSSMAGVQRSSIAWLRTCGESFPEWKDSPRETSST